MPLPVHKTTVKEQTAAKQSADALKQVTSAQKTHTSFVFQVGDKSFPVPRKAVVLFEAILEEMAEGRLVEVRVINDELTTQEAADLLQVSRPHLVKLLDTNKIPSKMVGTHRRVNHQDVMKYQSDLKEIRRKNLEFLAKEAQELKLGYE